MSFTYSKFCATHCHQPFICYRIIRLPELMVYRETLPSALNLIKTSTFHCHIWRQDEVRRPLFVATRMYLFLERNEMCFSRAGKLLFSVCQNILWPLPYHTKTRLKLGIPHDIQARRECAFLLVVFANRK